MSLPYFQVIIAHDYRSLRAKVEEECQSENKQVFSRPKFMITDKQDPYCYQVLINNPGITTTNAC